MTGKGTLLQQIESRIEKGNVKLSPASQIHSQLHEITREPDYDISKVIQLISSDVALTTEILSVANSAFYGGLTEINTVKDAVVRLGTPEIVRLAILVVEKSNYQVETPALKVFLEPLWAHAQATAWGSRWLAMNLGYENQESEAFIGGLLHDMGKLILVKVLDDILQGISPQPNLPENLIVEILDSTHCDQGYKMAHQWELPQKYCDIIRDHHQEDMTTASTLLNIVCLADKASIQLGIGLKSDSSINLSATEEAFSLDASDLKLAQLSIMLEDEMALV